MPLKPDKLNRFRPLLLAAAICAVSVLLPLTMYRGFGFVINYTDSLPEGVYRLYPVTEINLNTLIAIDVPEPYKDMVYGRGWLIRGGILIKPVAAMSGDRIDINDSKLYINGRYFGPVFKQDLQGLPLPGVSGSYELKKDGLFLASPYARSFDSRYFGPVTKDSILAEAKPVWTF